jgi:hypothetical protein
MDGNIANNVLYKFHYDLHLRDSNKKLSNMREMIINRIAHRYVSAISAEVSPDQIETEKREKGTADKDIHILGTVEYIVTSRRKKVETRQTFVVQSTQ